MQLDIERSEATQTQPVSRPDAPSGRVTRSVAGAVLAGIGASLCCVAPLVLLALGIGGTWISTLTALEPYRPIFIALTLVFLFLAFRKLYLVPKQCAPDTACAVPSTRRNQRLLFWLVSALLLGLLTFPYYAFVFFR